VDVPPGKGTTILRDLERVLGHDYQRVNFLMVDNL